MNGLKYCYRLFPAAIFVGSHRMTPYRVPSSRWAEVQHTHIILLLLLGFYLTDRLSGQIFAHLCLGKS